MTGLRNVYGGNRSVAPDTGLNMTLPTARSPVMGCSIARMPRPTVRMLAMLQAYHPPAKARQAARGARNASGSDDSSLAASPGAANAVSSSQKSGS